MSTPKPLTEPSLSDRTYQWETLELNVQLRWQSGSPRQVLITATSYDDFPIAVLLNEAALGELPPAIQALLEELKQNLPVRQLRYQQQAKAKPKAPTRPAPAPATRTPNPPTTTPTTQISLF